MSLNELTAARRELAAMLEVVKSGASAEALLAMRIKEIDQEIRRAEKALAEILAAVEDWRPCV